MQGKSIGQVYTLDAMKAKRNNALIAGTCLINDHPCFVLFDYGVTHSFVSIQCMKCLGLQTNSFVSSYSGYYRHGCYG